MVTSNRPEGGPTGRRAPWPSRRRVTNCLDVVPIGIKHEGTVVIRMVVHTQTGRPIVCSTRSERGAIERIHSCSVFCGDRYVHWFLQLAFAPDPKVGFAAAAEAGSRLPGLLSRRLHHQHIAQWRQRLFIERLGARIVRHRKSHVVDHDALC